MSDSMGSLREQLAVLRRHRLKMMVFFVGTLLLVTLGIVFFPRKYESQAKLHVLLGRESVSLDPTATTGQVINMMETREHEINTVKDLLGSRTVLEQVVEKLGPETILAPKRAANPGEPSESSWMDSVTKLMLKVHLADPVSEKEKAVKRLSTDVKVYSEPKSNVINVAFRSATPAMAQEIANEFLAAYNSQHGSAHRTQGSEDFFSEQTAMLDTELVEAEQRLRDAKSENRIVTIAASQLSLSKEIELVETNLLTTSVAIAASQATIQALEKSLVQMPERLVMEETSESSYAADVMRRTLYDLQINEQALAAKHTDEHPALREIRKQVAASQGVLDGEEKQRIQPTSSLNPASQQQKLALLAEQTLLAGYTAKYQSLETQLAQLHGKLKNLNDQETVVARLTRKVSLLQDDYMAYSRNNELARIDHELDSQRISNVNIVQPPTFVEKPVSPPKAIVMILGLLLATSGAVALALLCESLHDCSTTTQDIAAANDAPRVDTRPRLRRTAVTPK